MKTTPNTQIVATVGPSSHTVDLMVALIEAGVDIFRINLSWEKAPEFRVTVGMIRSAMARAGRTVEVLADLPGPRIQQGATHTYHKDEVSCLTDHDKELITVGIELGIEYFALSFVGSASDITDCRTYIAGQGGMQRIVAKIERAVAVAQIHEIVAVSDLIMVARGDLGNEVALEEIPFVQADIITVAQESRIPVIVATQMMLSMTEHPVPTRAEVTDVATAVLEGAFAVMLSEESASGKHPVEAVQMMRRIINAAHAHGLSRVHDHVEAKIVD